MKVYLVRHGQTDWNIENKVMGQKEIPLNEVGVNQAFEVQNKLKEIDIDLIFCSPLKRTRQTVEIINEGRNIPVLFDKRIVERDFGEFEGKEKKNFDFPGFWDYYRNEQYQKAENIQKFFNRVYDFLDDIIANYSDKNVLIVAHGGIGIAIACYFNKTIPQGSLLKKELLLNNCEVATYTI